MGKSGVLVEEDEEEMVPLMGDGMPIKRIGRFLKPRAKSASTAARVPPVPILRNAVSRGIIPWPAKKVVLEGWRSPQPKWKEWVERLRPIYQHLWKKAGIFDAVIASTYEVRRHPNVFFGMLLYWCPETNTFVFPWSEVTITLEDVMILGGFPVLGEPVRSNESLSGELGEMLVKMVAERKSFNKLSSKKASHYEWIKHYMEVGKADELEHTAFLSLWLSRFVFPAHPGKTVSENMFPIAIRLAQGTQIALGPAVLASLYRDLRLLRDHIFETGGEEAHGNFTVWAPFQFLQIWAWEHFIALRTDVCPNFLTADEPRAARWNGLDVKVDLSYVISVLESADEFQWRPYTIHLDDWRLPCFYKDDGQWISIREDGEDEDVRSFSRFIRASVLVGIDTLEQYLPHRVAMQFGLDQDLPGCVPRANSSWTHAWEIYNKVVEDVKVYIPPRLFESDSTLKFFNWQKECLLAHNEPGEMVLGHLEKPQSEKLMQIHQEGQTYSDAKGVKLEEQTVSPHAGGTGDDDSSESEQDPTHRSSSSAGHTQEQQSSNFERRMSRKRMLTKIYAAKLRRGDTLHHSREVRPHQGEEAAYAGELFNIEVKGVPNNLRRANRGPAFAPEMVDGLEGPYSLSYKMFRIREREKKAARLQKELELDAQIEKIKAEIAELQADVMNMDSIYEPEDFIVSPT